MRLVALLLALAFATPALGEEAGPPAGETVDLKAASLFPRDGGPVRFVEGGLWLDDVQALKVSERLKSADPDYVPKVVEVEVQRPGSGFLVPFLVGAGLGLLGGYVLASMD